VSVPPPQKQSLFYDHDILLVFFLV
jgi:hypothetical protein